MYFEASNFICYDVCSDNYIFGGFIIVGIIYGFITGNASIVNESLLLSPSKSVTAIIGIENFTWTIVNKHPTSNLMIVYVDRQFRMAIRFLRKFEGDFICLSI